MQSKTYLLCALEKKLEGSLFDLGLTSIGFKLVGCKVILTFSAEAICSIYLHTM